MILTFEALSQHRGQVAMVDGAFDPLHAGHIEYFRAAAELGLPVLCNVASDEYVSRKHAPLVPDVQRAAIVDAIRYITYTHINRLDTAAILDELRPRYYVKGKDWEARGLPQSQIDICARNGTGIVYLDTMRDSSTRLLERFQALTEQRSS